MALQRQSPSVSGDESNLFLDILSEAPLSGHRQPMSMFGGFAYCFLLAGYAVVAATSRWIFLQTSKLVPTLLCSCNVILLVATGIFQQHWAYQARKVRLQGYYIFSQKMKHLARLPFATIAYGTAVILLVIVWQPRIHILSLCTWLRIVMVAEVCCAGCVLCLYIGCVRQYNSLNGQPDVLKSLYTALELPNSLEELRYHDGGHLSDQQMALLQYQRENLHYLSEEVLRLQECLSKYERTEGRSTPQVDLAHLLAARDQELRALSAEMKQLQSEIRLARSLIAERDSEIQQLHLTNNQYVKENERLRAILNEWSARATKLERALEAERLSNMELQKNITRMRSIPTKETTQEHQA